MTKEATLKAAVAGLAQALGDFWPGAVPAFGHEKLLVAAERLAAGQEPGKGKTTGALRSIFDGLNDWTGERRYLPLLPLNLEAETLHPRPLGQIAGSQDDLKRRFQDALAVLGQWDGTQAWLENVLDLAQRYLWCVPAPQYGAESDVSRYDHGRITAALTVCLTAGGQPDGDVALLLGGDLSGVQEWLYTLSSSGAAKSLRGRSFYLQLLTEVIAYKILDDLGLPLTNLIYAGGGNFYLLAPVGAQTEVERLGKEIGAALLAAHAGDLYLALGSTPVTGAEFAAGEIGKAWGRANAAMSLQKQRRYANLGADTLAAEIGAPLSQGGKPDKVCKVCDQENPTGEPWQDDGDGPKCKLCRSLEELGSLLPDATHVVITRLERATRPERHINDWRDGMAALGYHIRVLDAGTASAATPPGAIFARIGRTHPQPDAQTDRQAAYAFREVARAFNYRPLINIVPRVEGRITTFDELYVAGVGIPQWGVLRMDVDNLGQLFQAGLGKRATLTRTAGLSFALRLFFEGRLSQIGARYNASTHTSSQASGVRPGYDAVYAMYSGGDDLFIVGAWSALPHLAHDIRSEFGRFVAGNPTITLSGGVSLAAERFPIHQAARQAGEAEDAAKSFIRMPKNGQPAEKDAFTFLGQAFGWEQFDDIWDRVRQLQEWSDAQPAKINRSLIQTLRAIDNEYRTGLERQRKLRAQGKPSQPGQFYYGPWMWKLVYQLSRVAEQTQHEEFSVWVKRLRDALVEPTGPIAVLGLIARWAEFLTRSTLEEQEEHLMDLESLPEK